MSKFIFLSKIIIVALVYSINTGKTSFFRSNSPKILSDKLKARTKEKSLNCNYYPYANNSLEKSIQNSPDISSKQIEAACLVQKGQISETKNGKFICDINKPNIPQSSSYNRNLNKPNFLQVRNFNPRITKK